MKHLTRLAAALALACGLTSPALAQSTTPPVVPYTSSSPVTAGTPVLPGRGVLLGCSGAGSIRFVMKDGTTADAYAQVGTAFLDNFSVTGVSTTGTTATCATSVLR